MLGIKLIFPMRVINIAKEVMEAVVIYMETTSSQGLQSNQHLHSVNQQGFKASCSNPGS